ncbi:hypothetical protein VitviT2T_011954 [Vitis vinifera]|uniref:PORR domain-containing protein n=2 Tax=Vitis vinifera TaxID=29760 RepID=A0ABY9CCG9_VITVI|nr:protein ROOT PRIMORDIUM DEFECTIVE 1 [Vitis vinifera]WJZ92988.1 hypothetical protein VitviT2T_011954 [Vitis vinifera]|eukprot:XP_010653682.1 PREDICTED: protein ROOT PRIMORDIUM DEFECTIVE 1 [Vitis vinifera]
MRALQMKAPTSQPFPFGPFNSAMQRRWKKPADTAQTRLENRTRDSQLDKLTANLKRLATVLQLQHLISKRRGPHVSVQIMSRWKNIVGLNVDMGQLLRKYPHIFEVFTHPVKRNQCCRVSRRMEDLMLQEEAAVKECELEAVRRLKKLLMMSVSGTLRVHALWLIRRELGLPESFRDSIIAKYYDDFKLVDLETVELVGRDEDLGVAQVEIWREREYREKWLSEFETKYAFPINLPTGFKIESGFREKLKNWQRLQYLKPYERKEVVRVRTCGGIERFEKRAVGILHELLSLTTEKMVEVERLSHFWRDFCMEVNVRELLLKHPGIFYISTRGNTQMVFLREAYRRGCLIEPNPVYVVRRKMLDLLLLGWRHSRELHIESKEESDNVVGDEDVGVPRDGDWVIPILDNFDDNLCEISDSSVEELNDYSENKNSRNEHKLEG